MRDLGVPSLRELGYCEDDIPELVEGALAQQRLLAVAPREVTEDDLAAILARDRFEQTGSRFVTNACRSVERAASGIRGVGNETRR